MAATLVTSVGSKCTRAHTQRWEVRGFSQLPSAVGAVKLSPTFTAFDREWHISVYPGGVAETNKGDVGVFLHLAKGNKLVLVSEVAIINQANSRTSAVPVASHEFSPDAVGWGLAKFLGRTTLLDETKGFVLNDVITFEVKLLAPAESKDLESVTTDLTLLSRATAELLASGLHSDVTLVVDGTTEIVAHKAILAARSPVFRAMFAHKMQETLEGRVLIDDMPPATMHSLLKYLYTGELSITPGRSNPSATSNSSSSSSSVTLDIKDGQSAKEAKTDGKEEGKAKDEAGDRMISLLIAADRFQVTDLVALCAEHLEFGLSVDNLAERLAVADQCGRAHLMVSCLDFIRADPARLAGVMGSDGWTRLRPEQVENMFADLVIPCGTPRPGGRKRARPADLAADPDMQPPSVTKKH